MIVQNQDLPTEISSIESSCAKDSDGQNQQKFRKNKRPKKDWAKRIKHFTKLKEDQKTKVDEIEEHRESFKKRGMLPDIKSFSKRSKS